MFFSCFCIEKPREIKGFSVSRGPKAWVGQPPTNPHGARGLSSSSAWKPSANLSEGPDQVVQKEKLTRGGPFLDRPSRAYVVFFPLFFLPLTLLR